MKATVRLLFIVAFSLHCFCVHLLLFMQRSTPPCTAYTRLFFHFHFKIPEIKSRRFYCTVVAQGQWNKLNGNGAFFSYVALHVNSSQKNISRCFRAKNKFHAERKKKFLVCVNICRGIGRRWTERQ